MKASQIQKWIPEIQPHEFPDGALDHMHADLFLYGLFPLRQKSGVPMSPSQLYEAHVRHEKGGSQHCTIGKDGKPRLSEATDIQLSSYDRLMKVFATAEQIEEIGGIGLYFDTTKPLFHIDMRESRLLWLAYEEGGERVYMYRENDYKAFYKKLGELLGCYI